MLKLGYCDTYHGYTAATENPRDCEMWLDAMAAKWDGVGKPFGRAEWDQLLGHCQVRYIQTKIVMVLIDQS